MSHAADNNGQDPSSFLFSSPKSCSAPLRAVIRLRSHHALCLLGIGLLATLSGCLGKLDEQTMELDLPTEQQGVDNSEIKQRLDSALVYTLNERELDTGTQAAWQILHGVLAFQKDFEVNHDGEQVSVIEHVVRGGAINGWDVRPGHLYDPENNRRGLISEMAPGSKAGQGHHDQWLAILSQCDLPESQEIQVGEDKFTMRDFVEQVKWDVPRNVDAEYSWTLIGLTQYEPSDSKWIASDGKEWSIERLLQSEVDQKVGSGACGGTHRLIGITMTLNRHLAQGGELTGVWEQAKAVIDNAVAQAKTHQNGDGTFSTNYITTVGSSPDLAANLGATGHVLEFLSLALPKEQLEEPWMRNATLAMCDIFDRTESIDLECGALYHAAHGLVLYREKVFGERSYRE